jgi:hypothetical protein
MITCLMLVACQEGGGAGGGRALRPPTGGAGKHAPTISMASHWVLVGRELRARPTASDADGQTLGFSISGKPEWLDFSPRNGEISGTPDAADVGTYDNIRITASDGQLQAAVAISITVTATAAGRATLSWNAPTQRTDGTPLADLAGFRVYFGSSAGDLRYVIEVRDPGARSALVEDLTIGTWYFAATAYDTSGVESHRSNTASKTIA